MGAFIMKKLLLACIFSIGFAQQLTAGVYEMIVDLFVMQNDVEQMRSQEQEPLKEIENLSLKYKKAIGFDLTDERKALAFSKTMWNVCDYQMTRQNKMFQQLQKGMPKNVQMMNSYTMKRE